MLEEALRLKNVRDWLLKMILSRDFLETEWCYDYVGYKIAIFSYHVWHDLKSAKKSRDIMTRLQTIIFYNMLEYK